MALMPLEPSVQLAYVDKSFSRPNAINSACVSRSEVIGADSEARNDLLVFVPKATLASRISAPPKTFRIRPVAVYVI